jgi:hypothetical protein
MAFMKNHAMWHASKSLTSELMVKSISVLVSLFIGETSRNYVSRCARVQAAVPCELCLPCIKLGG